MIDLMEIGIVFKAAVGSAIGYVMWKFKRIEHKVDESLDEQEIRQIIKDKLVPGRIVQGEIKEDLRRIEQKLDRLIERS